MMEYVNPGETLEDLNRNGLTIIQKKKGFRFGVDAVLLSDFAKVRKKDRVLDLCSGTGIIPLLLSAKTESPAITGLEIQHEFVDMARRSVLMNKLENRVVILEGDLCDEELLKSLPKVDVVTVNPPYKKAASGIINEEEALTLARHEVALTLEDVIRAARICLKDNGRLYLIHRPERLADLLTLMRQYRMEPKSLRMVYPHAKKAPSMVLVEGQRDGGAFLKVLPPLFVYDEDGSYSDEIRRIYGDDRR